MFGKNIKTGIYLNFENFWIVVYKGVKFGSYPFRQLKKAQSKLTNLIVEDDDNETQMQVEQS